MADPLEEVVRRLESALRETEAARNVDTVCEDGPQAKRWAIDRARREAAAALAILGTVSR